MLELVSQEEAITHLRLDETADGPWLTTFIPAISQAVALWLKDSWRLYVWEVDADGHPIVDSSGDPILAETSNGPTVNPVVRSAVLVELASQYRYREGEGDNTVPSDAGHGYILSRAATQLLVGLRKSTVA